MLTPDTSVVVAAFGEWHEFFEPAAKALNGVDSLISHVELETYSVLTRLPGTAQAPRDLASDYLNRRFPGQRLQLNASQRKGIIKRFAELGIQGGATYDALIAACAETHNATLLTCDKRALNTYERFDIEVELLTK